MDGSARPPSPQSVTETPNEELLRAAIRINKEGIVPHSYNSNNIHKAVDVESVKRFEICVEEFIMV